MKHLQLILNKCLILVLTFFFCNNYYALSVKDIKVNDYVCDYANVLTTDTENYIKEKSLALENIDGTQIVVVTLKTLEDNDLEMFANELYNKVGIGDKKESKGILILLVSEDRDIRVEVGDGLEGILNDGKVGRYIDNYMIPYFKDSNWNEGITNGYNAFYSEIVTLNNLNLEVTKPINKEDKEDFLIVIATISGIIYFTIGTYYSHKKFKLRELCILSLSYIPSILNNIGNFNWGYVSFVGILNTIAYILGRYFFNSNGYGGTHYRGSSHHSSGGFSGGGGHSSGGGASRHF